MLAEIEPPQVVRWDNNVPPTGGKGARARDYSDKVYKIIVKACTCYDIFIVTEQSFPDASQQTQKAPYEDIGTNYQVTDRITAIVSDHLLSFFVMIMLTYLPSRLKLVALAFVA